MDQRIDKRFKNTSCTVIGHFNTGISSFLPSGFHVSFYKTDTLIEQDNQAAGIFCAVKRIHHPTTFIKSVPTGAEQAGMTNGGIIRKQRTGIGELSV